MEIYKQLNTVWPSYMKKTFFLTNIETRLIDTKKLIKIVVKTEAEEINNGSNYKGYKGGEEEKINDITVYI